MRSPTAEGEERKRKVEMQKPVRLALEERKGEAVKKVVVCDPEKVSALAEYVVKWANRG